MASSFDTYLPAVLNMPLPTIPKTEFYKGSSSTWGQPIGVSAGVRRLPSYKIWLQGYRTVTNGANTYASWAVSFGYPLGFDPNSRRVVKAIWADGRLIWNSDQGAISSNDGGINWRFYPGTEDQRIDPLMEADHPGTTPAYRGQMIMVLENFPLYYFNEKVPSISAEIWDEERLDLSRQPMSEQLQLFAAKSGAYTKDTFDIDPALVDLESDGVYIETAMTFKDLLDVYAKFYDFDYCESQGVIKLFRAVNAGDYDVTEELTTSDLMAAGAGSSSSGSSDQSAVLTTRYDNAQIPITQTVQYRDRTQQYQMSIQRARRPQFPQASIIGVGASDDFTIPIVVTAQEAMTGAMRALYRAAHEKEQYNFQLPPNFMALEPGDIVQIDVGGKTYIAKINKTEIQADMSIKVNAIRVARGSDYAIDGFAGGVQNWLVQRAVQVGGFVNHSVFHGATFP